MKIVYIADNRDRHNFGCRGTSAALSSIISEKHEIVGRVSGKLTLNSDFVYVPFMPNIVNRIIYSNSYVVKLVRKIEQLLPDSLKHCFDFLSFDFNKSIKNIKEYSKSNVLYRELNLDEYDYDAIVINGEGSMIMTTPPRRDTLYYLLFIYWAKKRGKKAFLLNAMFSDCPKTGRNTELINKCNEVLSLCDFVSIRDPVSYKYVKDNIKIGNYKYIPDALFTWSKYINECFPVKNTRFLMPFGFEKDRNLNGIDLSGKDYVCISGSSSAAWNQTKAMETYMKLIKKIIENVHCTIILLEVCDGDAFLKDIAEKTGVIYIPSEIPIMLGLSLLANAKAYVSGRYHPSIMASLGGTPCVFMGSNSHKNIGLQKMLEYDLIEEFNAYPTEKDIQKICERLVYLINKDERRDRRKFISKCRANEAEHIIDYIV